MSMPSIGEMAGMRAKFTMVDVDRAGSLGEIVVGEKSATVGEVVMIPMKGTPPLKKILEADYSFNKPFDVELDVGIIGEDGQGEVIDEWST